MTTADGSLDAPLPEPKRVFVTSDSYTAREAPGACQIASRAMVLGGTWVAWLSYESAFGLGNSDAIDQITSDGPWALITGPIAFQTRAQLATTPSVAINVTENGGPALAGSEVWTGTRADGTTANSQTCAGWSDARNLRSAVVGDPNSMAAWTESPQVNNCSLTAHVYCFEL